MNVGALVVDEALRHIQAFGFVKGMDPLALHILKTSEEPRVVAMRHWMRTEALRQFEEAEREQKKMNDEFAQESYARRAGIRRTAVVHPYFATKAAKQGHSWGDKGFLGHIRAQNPKVFPKREAL